jgi:hypothetical protein
LRARKTRAGKNDEENCPAEVTFLIKERSTFVVVVVVVLLGTT